MLTVKFVNFEKKLSSFLDGMAQCHCLQEHDQVKLIHKMRPVSGRSLTWPNIQSTDLQDKINSIQQVRFNRADQTLPKDHVKLVHKIWSIRLNHTGQTLPSDQFKLIHKIRSIQSRRSKVQLFLLKLNSNWFTRWDKFDPAGQALPQYQVKLIHKMKWSQFDPAQDQVSLHESQDKNFRSSWSSICSRSSLPESQYKNFRSTRSNSSSGSS